MDQDADLKLFWSLESAINASLLTIGFGSYETDFVLIASELDSRLNDTREGLRSDDRNSRS
ncbi:MAG: hypothetical protein P4L46_19140 [Fimbriimonas sp.]|nr:hypothetical protein [Fimbriimonas sp.]